MKKATGIIAALLLTAGMAFAQNGDNAATNFDAGSDSASVSQSITLTIPQRLALHIHPSGVGGSTGTDWTLNLSNFDDNSQGTLCLAVPKPAAETIGNHVLENGEWEFSGTLSVMQATAIGLGILDEATSYPVVDIDGDGTVSGDSDKGYLACFFTKVIQKFANIPNTTLSAVLVNSGASDEAVPGFGHFGMAGFSDWNGQGFTGAATFATTSSYDTSFNFGSTGSLTTSGWMDELILEGFYFDGSERPGSHVMEIVYTLAPTL